MYWYNGELIDSQIVQLSINEPGLLYGANIFTTMRVHENSLEHCLTAWSSHCDRLKQSIQEFNWQQPQWQRLKQGAEILSQHFSVLRMVIFPDGREWITGRSLPEDLKLRQTRGITAWIAAGDLFQRNLAQHKTGNYLGAYLAREQTLKLDAQEAILLNHHEDWLETSTGNLWGKKDDCWYTPSLNSGMLPGIARSRLLNYLQKQHIPVEENIWTFEFVKTLDHIFYTNCVVKIVPIAKILTTGDCLDYPIVNLPQILNQL